MTPDPGAEAEWWCSNCRAVVPPLHVTYAELHDKLAGGCGYRVFWPDESEAERLRAMPPDVSATMREYQCKPPYDTEYNTEAMATELTALRARVAEGEQAVSRIEYLQRAYDAALTFIAASPCDPDITDAQRVAYRAHVTTKVALEQYATPAQGGAR